MPLMPSGTVENRKKHAGFGFVSGVLVALTLFLSGEQNERSGIVHLPAMLWLAAVAAWTVWQEWTKSDERIRFDRIDGLVYGFFGLVGLSTLWSLLPGQGGAPRPCLNMLSAWILFTAAWFLFRHTLHDPRLVGAVFNVVLAVLLAESLLGLYQQFVDIPRMIEQFEADPAGTIALADPSIEQGTPNWDHMVWRIQTALPMGTYPLSNTLGGLLACGFILTAGLQLSRPIGRRSIRDAAFLGVTFVLLLGLVLTKCRSGLIAVGVGIILLAFLSLRQRFAVVPWKRVVVASLAVAALFVVAATTGSGKALFAGAKKSLGFRLEYWYASSEMIRDFPILGCGSGNFKPTYMRYKLPNSTEEISDPHNFPVEIAAVSGIPALFLFLVPVVILLGRAGRGNFSTASDAATTDLDVRPLYWGGLAGCWLAFFLSFNSEAPMDFAGPVAASFAFPLFAWVRRRSLSDEIPTPLLAVLLLVLLVHLSAAGGISVTSTAILLWLALAALANQGQSPRPEARKRGNIHIAGIVVLVLSITAIFAVRHFGLVPVSTSRALLFQAETEHDVPTRVTLLRRAVAADRLSSALQNSLASETFRVWSVNPLNDVWRDATLGAEQEALRLAPRLATIRFMYAERMNRVFQRTGKTAWRDRALELYREAIERYPNHARFRVAYALLLWNGDQKAEAIRQRDDALRLDDLMPYADQKLPSYQRDALLALGDKD